MSHRVLIITDHPDRSSILVDSVSRRYATEMMQLPELVADPQQLDGFAHLILDLGLASDTVQERLKKVLDAVVPGPVILCITRGNQAAETLIAKSLGASRVLPAKFDFSELLSHIEQQLSDRVADVWQRHHAAEFPALRRIVEINDTLRQTLDAGLPLPKEEIDECCESVVSALEEGSISSWLDAVEQHHSYTHRHLMTVSGLVIAFGLNFGMRREDIQFLAVGAMMHDIGKARIPLKILDKPGGLSESEREEIKRHVEYSEEILREDGRFGDEVLEIARHHHEYLDGSGYPDGLADEQISNLVRVMTIVDVYAAMIDRRSYKEEASRENAYEMLLSMEGKLDMTFVKGFKPIALPG